ncbi:hypothetical protein COLO4_04202 [Corchorus olitorius]|uniref:TIR domain-containing protein n=1 Tax=Corchorus olitorius TaxID=93759 RepID=A0A1R3KUU7_9ROSI|nr:hypothetical protein COLO4_04202 [Corchorus olitorius]
MHIKSLLNIDDYSEVCPVGIWGIPGIGKTTIAEVVFNQISTQFEGRYFVENVKDKSRKHDRLLALREKLLSKLLDEDSVYLETLRMQSSYIKSRLRRRRVLIVLDDVNDAEKFKLLVKELAGFEALELFSWHAFERNHPPHNFLMLSYWMVNYAKGLPLALKVLGSALQKQPRVYWEGVKKKLLNQVSYTNVVNVLKSSFDGLDSEQKSIFLGIACFLNGDDHIEEILASSHLSTEKYGIEDLVSKSLITLSDKRVGMHDLLQEMGCNFVRDKSLMPGKRNSLWTPEDLSHVLRNNSVSGTVYIKGIFLDPSKDKKFRSCATVFSRMRNLRLPKFFSFPAGEMETKLLPPEQGLESNSSELNYLHWEGYPPRSLPSNFDSEKLVGFSMSHCNVEDFLDGPILAYEFVCYFGFFCYVQHILYIEERENPIIVMLSSFPICLQRKLERKRQAAGMVTSASGSSNIKEKYDVFISFRGDDTRDNLTSHLYAALERKNIKAFTDYELKKGGEISGNLEKAIEESKLSIVVFSKDYASSKWCLNELVNIIDCMRSKRQQIVIPIFYGITPSQVRKQGGSLADAFTKHQLTEGENKVQRWRAALIEAAALAGWDSSVTKPESVLVDEIVKDVLERLNHDLLPYMVGLVGINSRMMHIKSLLNMDEFPEVWSVGIWGMAGTGKTTIAQVVFNQISSQFEGRCFLENVKDKSRDHDGLYALRVKLLSKLLDEDSIYLETLRTQCTYISSRLRRRKVLIVLDDVNDPAQFEILVGGIDGFGPGSRIIVTSRDRQVLINCGVYEDKIYKVMELARPEATELFNRHAFTRNHPPRDFLELSDAMVNYANGLPLALKVLGSELQKKSSRYWKDTLNKLKQVPNPKIDDVLRTSLDGLDTEQKSIFLDIACFFNGDKMDHVEETLDSCHHSIYAGIEDLMDKSLVTVSDNRLKMHELLQEIGWDVVRNESNSNPGKRSRLWTPEDVYPVLTKNSGT